MRLVLDTNVLVAAQRSDLGASARLLNAAKSRAFVMLASTTLFIEYEAVLSRSEHLAEAGVDIDMVRRSLDALAGVIEPVAIRYSWRPAAADPGDDMVVDVAMNGSADAIVSFNLRAYKDAVRRFGVELMTPSQAWRRVQT